MISTKVHVNTKRVGVDIDGPDERLLIPRTFSVDEARPARDSLSFRIECGPSTERLERARAGCRTTQPVFHGVRAFETRQSRGCCCAIRVIVQLLLPSACALVWSSHSSMRSLLNLSSTQQQMHDIVVSALSHSLTIRNRRAVLRTTRVRLNLVVLYDSGSLHLPR